MIIKELEDTISLMTSSNYKERFQAEYFQLEIRLEKLTVFLNKWKNNELTFQPTCPYELLEMQKIVMENLLKILEQRAKLEEVDLNKEHLGNYIDNLV